MPIIPPTQKAEVGGLQFEAGPGKVSMRSYLKNKLKAKELGYSSSVRPLALQHKASTSNPVLHFIVE
jgi:hypothetical protein